MPEVPGQLTVGGEVISGVRLKIAPLELDTVPEGIEWDDLQGLERKTRIRFEGEAILTKTPSALARYDAENGIETGEVLGELHFKPIREGFKVTAVLSPAAIEEAWRKEHGAA